MKLTDKDSVFDGFCHRPFMEELDGWRNEMPTVAHYPSVVAARDTLAMFEEICALREEVWRLKREVASLKRHSDAMWQGTQDAHGAVLSAILSGSIVSGNKDGG